MSKNNDPIDELVPDNFGRRADDFGAVRALLADARERIKEAEVRGIKKIDDVDARQTNRMDELEDHLSKLNVRIIEWMPLISNLHKSEENKRNMTLLLMVAFVSNICAWLLTLFIFFIKKGTVG